MATSVNNRPGTKAQARFVRMSASKARQVLNLIRGKQVAEAAEILEFSERGAAKVIAKALASAVANAQHNEDLIADELFVSACFADEGPTLKRFRPRARGRAGRIHKQTCHVTVEVSRLTDDELDTMRAAAELRGERKSSKSSSGGDRAARVAKSKAADADADEEVEELEETEVEETEVEETEAAAEETAAEVEETEVEETEAEAAEADDEAVAEEEEK